MSSWLYSLLTCKKTRDEGLTLLECLVAISVIGISSAVIAPVMLFSIATRVQSQKAEQALQLAQLEVDSIRIEVERGGDYSTALSKYPQVLTDPTDTLEVISNKFVSAAAPITSLASLNDSDITVAKKVDVNNDGDIDFAIQVFRTDGWIPAGATTPTAFKVGVRVYDEAALVKNTGSMLKVPASLSFTSGEGQRGLRPLAVLYADVFQSDQDGSLCEYHRYTYEGTGDATDGLECS